MIFLEFPGRTIYHYGKEEQGTICPYCSCDVRNHRSCEAFVVAVRSEGRRLCKQCWLEARIAGVKIPPRTAEEREAWQ